MEATPACQLKNRRVSFGMARREDMKTQHAIPVTQEKIALAEWDKDARPSERVNIPEIYKSTIDTPAKVSLIYPAVVHSPPPPSIPSGADY